MKPNRSSFDQAYLRWRGEFALLEARCFEALCEFVRVHFDDLLDRYYGKGHESLQDFPAWAFECYIQDIERKKTLCGGWKRKGEKSRAPK
jgi:hypothetical protein